MLAEDYYEDKQKKLGDVIQLNQAIFVIKSIFPLHVAGKDFASKYKHIANLYFNPPFPDVLMTEFGYQNPGM